MYATNFALRSKNSSGTVQATFSPLVGIGRNVNVRRGDQVFLDRELVTKASDNYHKGFKQVVEAEFTDVGKCIRGAATYSSLEATLNAWPEGGTIEYSIDGESNWIPCELESLDRDKPEDKNVAVHMAISLVSKAVVASPFDVS